MLCGLRGGVVLCDCASRGQPRHGFVWVWDSFLVSLDLQYRLVPRGLVLVATSYFSIVNIMLYSRISTIAVLICS